MSQIKHSIGDTNLIVNSGSTGGSTAIQNTSPNVAGGRRVRETGARPAGLHAARSACSEPLGLERHDLGRRPAVTYGALVGGKLINASIPSAQREARRGHLGDRSRATRSSGRPCSGWTSRPRCPGSTPTCTTSASQGCCMGGSSGRAARGAYGFGAAGRLGRPDLDQAHPRAQVVQSGNFLGVVAPTGVRRDPGRGAAQGDVEGEQDALRQRQPLGRLPGPGQRRARSGEGLAQVGNVDSAIAGAAKTVSATYMYHYNGHMPIGPCCSVATSRRRPRRSGCSSQSIEGIVTRSPRR